MRPEAPDQGGAARSPRAAARRSRSAGPHVRAERSLVRGGCLLARGARARTGQPAICPGAAALRGRRSSRVPRAVSIVALGLAAPPHGAVAARPFQRAGRPRRAGRTAARAATAEMAARAQASADRREPELAGYRGPRCEARCGAGERRRPDRARRGRRERAPREPRRHAGHGRPPRRRRAGRRRGPVAQ